MIFIFIAIIIGIIVYNLVCFHNQKYTNFIEQNSIALKNLTEINQRYVFYPYADFNQMNMYDNKKLYDEISCSDFLIYQLQYISKKVFDQVAKINFNKREYQNYRDEIALIEFGQFNIPTGKLKIDRLLKEEKLKVEQIIYTPPAMDFSIKVTLYCAMMNGQTYDAKKQIFSVEEILAFDKRLKNKSGSFHNDREIWNALCRVERGKVSNKMRFSIYERDGYRCRHCGVSDRYVDLEIDHIIPISKGGKTTYDNLQTLCRKCNYEKGNSLYHRW